jgi:cell filamentation protein
MPDSKYTYPNGILRNKFDIRDAKELSDMERKITSKRNAETILTPIKGNFDFNHLKAIHKALFSDVYDWAGKERTVDISKSNLFSLSIFIQDNAKKIFGDIQREGFLIGVPKERAIQRLAYYMGEINALL